MRDIPSLAIFSLASLFASFFSNPASSSFLLSFFFSLLAVASSRLTAVKPFRAARSAALSLSFSFCSRRTAAKFFSFSARAFDCAFRSVFFIVLVMFLGIVPVRLVSSGILDLIVVVDLLRSSQKIYLSISPYRNSKW
ncbi:hypothetical protein BGZ57DRAFT_892491 [Hyaloscypha finlandica]|nr:hypothetical protein BGZ57DRAFT_892491 [Hyaloscypha finlandica]